MDRERFLTRAAPGSPRGASPVAMAIAAGTSNWAPCTEARILPAREGSTIARSGRRARGGWAPRRRVDRDQSPPGSLAQGLSQDQVQVEYGPPGESLAKQLALQTLEAKRIHILESNSV
jgi:hypothetical protein